MCGAIRMTDETQAASAAKRQRQRSPRRDLRCPLHPDERLMSCSPKRYLAATRNGQELAGPVGMDRFMAWARRLELTPLGDSRWLEEFFCPACGSVRLWQVQRDTASKQTVHPIPDGVKTQLCQAQRLL